MKTLSIRKYYAIAHDQGVDAALSSLGQDLGASEVLVGRRKFDDLSFARFEEDFELVFPHGGARNLLAVKATPEEAKAALLYAATHPYVCSVFPDEEKLTRLENRKTQETYFFE